MKLPPYRLKTTLFLHLLLLGLLCMPQAQAESLPSFSLDFETWYATDIVVATEGEAIDGNFQVLEVCKGDLKVGSQLSLSALAQFASEERRGVYVPGEGRLFAPGLVTEKAKPKTYVSGSRMWLFLSKAMNAPQPTYSASPTSVAWIEPTDTYAFQQLSNPGPCVLTSLGMPESQLRARVNDLLQIQQGIANAAALPDPWQRVEALRPFARNPHFLVSEAAFAEIGKCGAAALPTLRAMLDDQSLRLQLHDVFKALGNAGGVAVGPELTRMLETETLFWKQETPHLQDDWLTGNGYGMNPDYRELLFFHAGRLGGILSALQKVRYRGSLKAVTQLRNFWVSWPQLNAPGTYTGTQINELFEVLNRP